MASSASVSAHVEEFERNRTALAHTDYTSGDAQTSLGAMLTAVELGQLAQRRLVTKPNVMEAVAAFRKRGGDWESGTTAPVLGRLLRTIHDQLSADAIESFGLAPVGTVRPPPSSSASTSAGASVSAPAGAATAVTGATPVSVKVELTRMDSGAATNDAKQEEGDEEEEGSRPPRRTNPIPGMTADEMLARANARRRPGGTQRQANNACQEFFQHGRCSLGTSRKVYAFVFLVVFSLGWFGGLSVALISSAIHVAEQNGSKDWTRTMCVVNSHIMDEECEDSCSFIVRANVDVTINGVTYTRDTCQYAFCASTDSSDATALFDTLDDGSSVPCWYDPDDIANMKLDEGIPSLVGSYVGIFIPAGFMLIPLCIYARMYKNLREMRIQRRMWRAHTL